MYGSVPPPTLNEAILFLTVHAAAVEFMDGEVLDIVLTQLPLHSPLSSSHPFYVLVETSGSHDQHDKEVHHYYLGPPLYCVLYSLWIVN